MTLSGSTIVLSTLSNYVFENNNMHETCLHPSVNNRPIPNTEMGKHFIAWQTFIINVLKLTFVQAQYMLIKRLDLALKLSKYKYLLPPSITFYITFHVYFKSSCKYVVWSQNTCWSSPVETAQGLSFLIWCGNLSSHDLWRIYSSLTNIFESD